MSTPQQEFDAKYVCTRELLERLKVTRPTISQAVRRGLLPKPIVVNDSNIFLWLREETEKIVSAWETMLIAKRANKK
jgi:predicted DNA-binding transcriptional regulator AlpA